MITYFCSKRFAALLIVLCLLTGVHAQYNDPILPLDKNVKTGQLPNGFTYFIRRNAQPEKRVFFYLVNKVGSILETDGQRGLAHFMEHMSFNGTKHFPKNDLVQYLQRSGVRFGADLNAYTGFDETVYQLPLPSDDPALLKNGLQIMRDWAQDASLDPTEIDKERGVVLEEKRLGLGLGERINDKVFPVLTNQSKYAARSPIGVEEVLKTFPRDTILTFYKNWYRPNLQALIVVGDIDAAAMEAAVTKLFGDLKMPATQKPRINYSIPLTGANQFLAFADQEVTNNSIQVLFKKKALVVNTKSGYRQLMVRTLFNQLINEQIVELTQKGPTAFMNASISADAFVSDLDLLSVNINVKNTSFVQAFSQVWNILSTVQATGFTQAAITRAETNMLSYMESAVKEMDKQNSENLIKEYVRYFTKQEAAPGIETEYSLMKELFKTLKPEDFKNFAAAFLNHGNRDVIVMGPDKTPLPTEETVNTWLATNAPVQATATTTTSPVLFKEVLTAGKVLSIKKQPAIDVTELVLSNGLKVILKPTTFKNDEVQFSAQGPGGTSLYNDADYASASVASSVINASGVGECSPVELSRLLTGKRVGVQTFIGERSQGVTGFSTVKDLESALQLVYLYFTKPRIDTTLFNQFMEGSREAIRTRYQTPYHVFSDTVSTVLGNYSLRRQFPSLERFNTITADKILQIQKERFANTRNVTFVFTGSFTVTGITPLLEKYLGSLPSTATKEQARDLGIHIPTGSLKKVVHKGQDDKATVQMVFSGQYDYNDNNNLLIEGVSQVIGFRLIERLRETEGGVYSPGVQASYSKEPTGNYAFTIVFGCSPANVEKMIKATLEEIRSIKTKPVLADDLVKFKTEQQRLLERQQKENGFWLQYLTNQYANQEDASALLHYPALLNKITASDLQQAANKYLQENNCIQFILFPEP